jgi:hypothetical protein
MVEPGVQLRVHLGVGPSSRVSAGATVQTQMISAARKARIIRGAAHLGLSNFFKYKARSTAARRITR